MAAEASEHAADMHLAQLALSEKNRSLALMLLDKYRPQGKAESPGGRPPKQKAEIDLRGWEWRYLWRLCQPDASFSLHRKAATYCLGVTSPDGRWLAKHTGDGVVL